MCLVYIAQTRMQKTYAHTHRIVHVYTYRSLDVLGLLAMPECLQAFSGILKEPKTSQDIGEISRCPRIRQDVVGFVAIPSQISAYVKISLVTLQFRMRF